jgi:hypothetical protein
LGQFPGCCLLILYTTRRNAPFENSTIKTLSVFSVFPAFFQFVSFLSDRW